jgi:DnaK suppressor protein
MPLKKQEIEKFKNILLEAKAHILHQLEGSSADMKQYEKSKGYSQHQADEGTDDYDTNLILEISSKGYDVLKQINRALEKIEDGTYGICDVTGAEIPKKRLEAIPYATMTVEAQSKLEKGHIR